MKNLFTLVFIGSALWLNAQVVSEDFDSSDGSWVGSSDSATDYWEHGMPAGTQISDDNSGVGSAWVTGLSGDFTMEAFDLIYLTSPTYDLSSLSSTGSVSFAINFDLGTFSDGFDDYNDGVLFLYSLDGFDWFEIGTNTSGNNWYNDTFFDAWSGNSGGWITASHDLPAEVLGEASVQFRFLFFTNAETTATYGYEGFGFDDFQILSTSSGGGSGGGSGGSGGVDPNSQFLTFELSGEAFPAVINDVTSTVRFFVPPSTDVTNLAPTFTLSSGATSNITSGTPQNFSSAVTYTVTASGGATSTDWTISAIVPTIGLDLVPNAGFAGSEVTIYGRGFSSVASENTVSVEGTNATVLTASSNKLTVEIPTTASLGLNEVSVTVNGISSTSNTYYNVLASGVTGTFEDYKENDFNLTASSGVVNSMEVGDLDGDGDLDFVYDNETILNITTIENGVIQSTVSKVTDRNNFSSSFDDLTIVDVDGDGNVDVVAGGLRVGWFKNNGDGTWADESIIDDFSSDYTIRVFDIDGDFDVDILVYDDFDVYSFTNSGTGVFVQNSKTVPSKLGQIIDWDEDGDLDMINVGSSSNLINLATNDGSGDFTDITIVTAGVSNIDFVKTGDLDNDGDLDFVYSTANFGSSISTVGYILNNGDGSFATEVTVSTEGIFDTKRIELGDLNNDGFLDIARTKSDGSDNVFQVYVSSGLLTYSNIQTLDSSTGGLDLVLVDIDQDGDMDILQEASQSGGYFPLFIHLLQDAEIEAFSIADETGSSTINSGSGTVSLEVIATADVTSLTPTIGLSPSASVSPNSGVAQNFTDPVVYSVTAEDGVTNKQWTVTVSQVPAVPSTSINNIDQESADISWTVSNSAATSFELELSTVEDFSGFVSGFDPLVINSGSTLSSALSSLSPGTTYYARIRGKNDLETYSDYSSTVTFLTISGTPVANLATDIMTESFVANWDAGAGADEYTLEVSSDNFTSTVFTTTVSETSATVTGLGQGTTYEYRVLSTNATGSSDYSNEVQVTTNFAPTGISLDSETVNENEDVGTVVGAISTADLNHTGANDHTYELVSGNGDADNASFDIDGSNLITNQIFDFENKIQFNVRIQTTDPNGATFSDSFIIIIVDVNDAPTAIAIETSCCNPTGYDEVGTKVADLFATDQDGDDLTFTLTQGGDSFTVNNNTNSISTAVVFETEVDLVVPITLQAMDPEGANVSENFNITITGFVDTEAPVISPFATNSETFLSGGPESLTLGLTIVDEFRLSEVKFHSRLLTEAEFTETVLTSDNNEYTVTIMEADLGVAGIEYFFEAIDAAGNSSFTDISPMSLTYPETDDPENSPKVESVTRVGRTVDSYQIISIPFDFKTTAAKRVDAIFDEFSNDDLGSDYRIIRWDPTSGENGALDPLGTSETIELGEGYFFITAVERSITVGSANINLQDPFTLELKKGWNLIGNPYTIDVSWTSVLTNNGAEDIVGPLRVLNPESAETWPVSDILKTLEGAFVHASEDIPLNIGYADASITFGGGRTGDLRPDPDWFFPITLEQNGDFRKGGIGMDRHADESFDLYDEPVLPKWLEYLEIAFLHEGERFSKYNKDVIPLSDSKIWDFEVSSSSAGTSVLKWDPSVSQVRNLKLLDVQRGRIIDMNQQSSYSFELDGKASFKILYSNDLSAQFDFGQQRILDAYPNPFVSSFKIPVRLPISSLSQSINVSLLDLSGKQIWSSGSTPITSGAYEFEVVRPVGLKPGVYLYEVAVTEGTSTNVYTKRISLR